MEKINFSFNGQWSLSKASDDYSHVHDYSSTIPVGKHTVEIHPHIDHLHNIKGHIAESGKDHMTTKELKQMGGHSKDFLNSVPRDGKGKITAQGIDDHIANLPKHKVDIHIAPYDMKAQQHRPGDQHVASMQIHDDTWDKMSDNSKSRWNRSLENQHKFNGIDHESQFGWARIDPKGSHWHIDEIQSDFNRPDNFESYGDEHYYEKQTQKDLHQHLSHGHDDPNHAIHSAVNQLARQHNVKSMSMDTPEDQAKQSWLQENHSDLDYSDVSEAILARNLPEDFDKKLTEYTDALVPEHRADTAFKSLHDKGGDKLIDYVKNHLKNDRSSWIYNGSSDRTSMEDVMSEDGYIDIDKKTKDTLLNATNAELDALGSFANRMDTSISHWMQEHLGGRDKGEGEKRDLPVHQINTYNKRPKKLGMERKSKNDVLGEHEDDKQTEVQYHKLHKALEELRSLIGRI